MDKNVIKEKVLSKIIKRPITKVIAGGSIGSIITLVIGDDEYEVVVYSSWRLEDKDKILTGWNESNDSLNGNLTKNIKQLNRAVIQGFEISNFFDLKINFDTGKTLNIFCDITPSYEPEEYDINWVISDVKANKSYAISKTFSIVVREYE